MRWGRGGKNIAFVYVFIFFISWYVGLIMDGDAMAMDGRRLGGGGGEDGALFFFFF